MKKMWQSGVARHPAAKMVPRSGVRRLLVSFALVVSAPWSVAVTITVNSAGDTIAVDGAITLREAITAANTNAPSGDAPAGSPGYDCIRFTPAVLATTIRLRSL
jgi:hypothetical protein